MSTSKREKARYISNKIKELRLKTGWSQAELAKKAEVTGAAISQIEKGDRLPSLIVGRKIAAVFNIGIEELFGESTYNSGSVQEDIQTFYRKYGSIESLSENDKEMIRNLIERLNMEKDENNKS